MLAGEYRAAIDTDDTGMEILPGVVCVDLAVVDLDTMTVDDLRDAMAEANAQGAEADLDHEQLLGDFDINPL